MQVCVHISISVFIEVFRQEQLLNLTTYIQSGLQNVPNVEEDTYMLECMDMLKGHCIDAELRYIFTCDSSLPSAKQQC